MLPKTSIKFVPAEYHSQSAIAAAFALRPRIGDPSRIRSIEIATFRTAVEIIGQDPEKWRPQTRETADHSLPYCTAVALVDGEVTAAQFTPERLNDPALIDLVSRTTVVEDPDLTAGYPAGIPNRITVTLDDGIDAGRVQQLPAGPRQEPSDRRPTPRQVRRPGRADPRCGSGREAVGPGHAARRGPIALRLPGVDRLRTIGPPCPPARRDASRLAGTPNPGSLRWVASSASTSAPVAWGRP